MGLKGHGNTTLKYDDFDVLEIFNFQEMWDSYYILVIGDIFNILDMLNIIDILVIWVFFIILYFAI